MDNNENAATVRRFCSKCGAELEEDALFCSECGAPWKAKTAVPAEETAPAEVPAQAPQAESPVATPTMPVEDVSAAAAPGEESQPAATEPEPVAETAKEAVAEELPKPSEPVMSLAAPAVSDETKLSAPPAPAAATAAPAATVAPALAPKPESTDASSGESKFCIRCGASLPADAAFCQKCGAPQGAAASAPASPAGTTVSVHLPPVDTAAFMAGVNQGGMHHVLLAAAVVAALSIFLPIVNVVGMANLKLMDISQPVALLIFVLGAGTAYASMIGKYEIPVVTGHGFLFTFLYGAYKYQSKISELEKGFWGALAKNSFRAEWGVYVLVLAILALIVGGLVASVQKEGKAPGTESLLGRWKQYMLQPVKIHTLNFPGLAWAVGIAIVLIFIAMQSQGAKQLGL